MIFFIYIYILLFLDVYCYRFAWHVVPFIYAEELNEMMRPESGLKWSPWFRIIAERFLPTWWNRLDDCLHGKAQDLRQLETIHQILVPEEALG